LELLRDEEGMIYTGSLYEKNGINFTYTLYRKAGKKLSLYAYSDSGYGCEYNWAEGKTIDEIKDFSKIRRFIEIILNMYTDKYPDNAKLS